VENRKGEYEREREREREMERQERERERDGETRERVTSRVRTRAFINGLDFGFGEGFDLEAGFEDGIAGRVGGGGGCGCGWAWASGWELRFGGCGISFMELVFLLGLRGFALSRRFWLSRLIDRVTRCGTRRR